MGGVANKPKVDLGRSCWSADYLLGHCESFRVESVAGRLGYVEEVVWAPDGSKPIALRVSNARGCLAIPIANVRELHADGEWLVARAPDTARANRPLRARRRAPGRTGNPTVRVPT